MSYKSYCRITPSQDMNKRADQKRNIDTGSHWRLLCSYLLKALIYINVYKTFFVDILQFRFPFPALQKNLK